MLGGDASIYEGALSTENTTFAYVKRKVDQDKGEEVQGLGLDGIYFLDDMKRVYPYGSIAGQILGLVMSTATAKPVLNCITTAF